MIPFETEQLDAIRDSITATLPLLRELAGNSSPEPYTIENLWWTKFDVIISIIAAILGALGTWYGYKGFIQSRKTAQNVVRVSNETQFLLCSSYIFDLIRNYIRAVVVDINYHSQEKIKYPTENYISTFTLSEFQDAFFPESFNQNPEAYLKLTYVKQRLLVYNATLSVIATHCSQCNIQENDCNDLLEKPIKIIKAIFYFVDAIGSIESSKGRDSIKMNVIQKMASIRRPMSADPVYYKEIISKIQQLRTRRKDSPLLLENIMINDNSDFKYNPFYNDELYCELLNYYGENEIAIFKTPGKINDHNALKKGLHIVMEYNIVFELQQFIPSAGK
jgi:hypothetical protein